MKDKGVFNYLASTICLLKPKGKQQRREDRIGEMEVKAIGKV